MRVIGLTGGMASGKTTVADMLRGLGADVIDADNIAREIVEPGRPVYREIVEAFGREILAADGTLDRKRLASRIFSDPAARRRLEGIMHPRIIEESERRLDELRRRGVGLAIYEAALLVETGRHRGMDELIVVIADESEQVRRLVARDGIDDEDARRRLSAQLPAAAKTAVAHHVVRCQGRLADVRRRVEELWRVLTA